MVDPNRQSRYNRGMQNVSETVAFYTLGCKTNQLESSAIADEFKHRGWRVVPFTDAASLYVVNTCTVTEDGDRESRRMIRKAKRQNPWARVAVTGCYAQVAPDAVAQVEGVNYVIGNNYKQDIVNIIETVPPENGPVIKVSEMDKSRVMAGASLSAIDRTRASLKIQDGCDFKCTYCIIWVARGPSRSLPMPLLKEQLADLVGQGHHEIVLTGINIGQYQNGGDLAALLKELITLPGEFRLRLSSLDPAEVTDGLLNIAASSEKICPYFHLSLQSAEDFILKRMARRHRVSDLYRVCESIQKQLPGASIGADIISGFPGETDARFDATYGVLSDLPLSYFHAFTYSKRQETPAAEFPDQVSDTAKKARTQALIDLSQEKNFNFRKNQLGKTVQVVVENGQTHGMSEYLIKVDLDRLDLERNMLVPVEINQVSRENTQGRVLV